MLFFLAVVERNERAGNVLQQLSEHWDGRLFSPWFLLIGLALLLVGVWGLRMWQHRGDHPVRDRSFATFWEVAGYLHLSWSSRWLLVRVARYEHLPSPLTLLVSSATLRHHARRYAESATRGRRRRILRAAARIGQTIGFDDDVPDG